MTKEMNNACDAMIKRMERRGFSDAEIVKVCCAQLPTYRGQGFLRYSGANATALGIVRGCKGCRTAGGLHY